MPNKYFQIDGVATYVHHQGRTSLPEVPPDLSRGDLVLCLHGAGGNGAVFDALAEKLADAHSPLAFDQPGHGRSGGLDSLGCVSRMADFAQAFTDKLGLRPRVLLGHSMGGAVAMQLALVNPASVRALVLVGSFARREIPDEVLEQSRRVTEGKERRQFGRETFSPKAPSEVMRRGFMEELKTDPRAAYGDLLAVAEWNATHRLAEIEVPTLVVRGSDELAQIAEQSDLLARGIAGARGEVIQDAGHQLPLEQPEALAAVVSSFLSGLSQ